MVLGETGRNFAAGMSGGIAYVYDKKRELRNKCNFDMVKIESLDAQDSETIHNLLSSHYRYTQSPLAKNILDNFEQKVKFFSKVMPLEYKRILESRGLEEKMELAEVSDG